MIRLASNIVKSTFQSSQAIALYTCSLLLAFPSVAHCAEKVENHSEVLHGLPVWSVIPFAGMLLSIALLPLFAPKFWHSNLNRFLVAMAFAAPVVGYLIYLDKPGIHALEHSLLEEYVPFIALLGSLYVISGGIVLSLHLRPSTSLNGLILVMGAIIANLIGTTGASMLLIRPFLRVNESRANRGHLPIFFIFMVSNLGGLLTPLGDPPLFLGYLRGISFFWTLQLWQHWLVANSCVLAVFLVWDKILLLRDPNLQSASTSSTNNGPRFALSGTVNFLLLGGVIAAVLCKPFFNSDEFQAMLDEQIPGKLVSEGIMVFLAVLSILLTPRVLRVKNGYSWEPIVEVAALFIGIFITMVPALALLQEHGEEFGISQPWQYFWLTGSLSGFLDNAPTYLTFTTLAAGSQPISSLQFEPRDALLAAISCGAVFMGALSYIGNGPNFMVKAISDEMGYRTPSFFGYMAYSMGILLPIFVLVTFLFL